MKHARQLSARKFWINVHLYLALSVGAIIALLGLTGSLLIFHPAIDQSLNPELTVTPGSELHVSADQALAVVAQQFQPRPVLVWMPRDGSATYVFELEEPRADVNRYHIVTVDATSGEVLGARVWGDTFITMLFDLHTQLFLGEAGLTLVGCMGVLLIVSVLTGLYLWWPRPGFTRRAFLFRAKRGVLASIFELHRLGGMYLSVVLLIIAVAGTYIVFPSLLSAPLGAFAEVVPEPEDLASAPASGTDRPVSLESVRRAAQTFAPGGRITSISLPSSRRDPYSVRYVDHGEPENRNGRSTVWIDQFSGRVLGAHAYSRLGGADRYLALQLPLHNGEILGLPGRWIAFASGLVLAALYVTGLYLWWKRRTPRKVSQRA